MWHLPCPGQRWALPWLPHSIYRAIDQANVGAVGHALEPYFLNVGIGMVAGLCIIVTEASDVQHASACRYKIVLGIAADIIEEQTGVTRSTASSPEIGKPTSRSPCPGSGSRGRPRPIASLALVRPLHCSSIYRLSRGLRAKGPLKDGFAKPDEIALHFGQDGLGLGVAKADIDFDDFAVIA